MKPTVPPEPRCELCGLKRSAPRHRNGDMQSFHKFEEPEAAAVPHEPPTECHCKYCEVKNRQRAEIDFCGVCLHGPHAVAACSFKWENGLRCKCTVGRHASPPEPAPPTLDPATLYRQALDALINGVEFGLKRYAEAGDGLLAAALERARDAIALIEREPPAAPPTVAPARPAREVAHELICQARGETWCRDFFDGQGSPKPGENYDGYHGAQCDDFTAQLAERDRASRSPGPPTSCPAQWEGATAWCSDACWVAGRHVPSALRGEGPSPAREGMELKSGPPPLSGLDAATVEGLLVALDEATKPKDREYTGGMEICDVCCLRLAANVKWCAAHKVRAAVTAFRALATPPGQTKRARTCELWPRCACGDLVGTPPGQAKP